MKHVTWAYTPWVRFVVDVLNDWRLWARSRRQLPGVVYLEIWANNIAVRLGQWDRARVESRP